MSTKKSFNKEIREVQGIIEELKEKIDEKDFLIFTGSYDDKIGLTGKAELFKIINEVLIEKSTEKEAKKND